MNRYNPIVSALRTQLKSQPRTGLKQEIQKQLEGVKYE